MDGQKTQHLDTTKLSSVPPVALEPETADAKQRPKRRLSTDWSFALALAPLLLFVAIGEFAPEPAADPTTVGLLVSAVVLVAMFATTALALAHRVTAAIPAIGLGAFGVYGQVDCAMQSHDATGTVGFWIITAAFVGLGAAGIGAGASSLINRR